MKSNAIKLGKIGVVDYKIYDVIGDGNCFYRAIFHVLQEASDEIKEDIGIDGYDTSNDSDEEDAIEVMRGFIADSIKNKHPDSVEIINNACSLANNGLLEEMTEMYPFLTTKVCRETGEARYKLVASMIENIKQPMYASFLEVNHIKMTLSREDGADITLLTIDTDGSVQSKKWQKDLIKLLENATTINIIVLLNVTNIHYQYLSFKSSDDNKFHTIINRVQLLSLLNIGYDLSKLSINGGSKRKGKQLRLSVLSSTTP